MSDEVKWLILNSKDHKIAAPPGITDKHGHPAEAPPPMSPMDKRAATLHATLFSRDLSSAPLFPRSLAHSPFPVERLKHYKDSFLPCNQALVTQLSHLTRTDWLKLAPKQRYLLMLGYLGLMHRSHQPHTTIKLGETIMSLRGAAVLPHYAYSATSTRAYGGSGSLFMQWDKCRALAGDIWVQQQKNYMHAASRFESESKHASPREKRVALLARMQALHETHVQTTTSAANPYTCATTLSFKDWLALPEVQRQAKVSKFVAEGKRIQFFTRAIRKEARVRIINGRLYRFVKRDPFDTQKTSTTFNGKQPGACIFTLVPNPNQNGKLVLHAFSHSRGEKQHYSTQYIAGTNPHETQMGVMGAGIMKTNPTGQITYIAGFTGHFGGRIELVLNTVLYLHSQGADLSQCQVDLRHYDTAKLLNKIKGLHGVEPHHQNSELDPDTRVLVDLTCEHSHCISAQDLVTYLALNPQENYENLIALADEQLVNAKHVHKQAQQEAQESATRTPPLHVDVDTVISVETEGASSPLPRSPSGELSRCLQALASTSPRRCVQGLSAALRTQASDIPTLVW